MHDADQSETDRHFFVLLDSERPRQEAFADGSGYKKSRSAFDAHDLNQNAPIGFVALNRGIRDGFAALFHQGLFVAPALRLNGRLDKVTVFQIVPDRLCAGQRNPLVGIGASQWVGVSNQSNTVDTAVFFVHAFDHLVDGNDPLE